MPYPYTTLLFWTLPTFTVLVGIGIILSILIMILYHDRIYTAKILDIYIGCLIGAVVMARIFHVVLDWAYFSTHHDEILRLTAGGLNWHGAVIGGLIGVLITAKWRKVYTASILDVLTLVLPLMMFMTWWACGASACAYGEEIQNLSAYPSWLVWEERDIYGLIYPRYATQPLGMMIAALLMAFALLLIIRGWLKGWRFGLMLALISLSMFAIGFLRGDATTPPLDLMMFLIGLVLSYVRTNHRRFLEPSAR